MTGYVLRRILVMIPVFLGATLLIYGMVFLLPGDPIVALGGDRPLSPAVIAQLRAQYHLDQPFWMQYLRYLGAFCAATSASRSPAYPSVTFWRRHFR